MQATRNLAPQRDYVVDRVILTKGVSKLIEGEEVFRLYPTWNPVLAFQFVKDSVVPAPGKVFFLPSAVPFDDLTPFLSE